MPSMTQIRFSSSSNGNIPPDAIKQEGGGGDISDPFKDGGNSNLDVAAGSGHGEAGEEVRGDGSPSANADISPVAGAIKQEVGGEASDAPPGAAGSTPIKGKGNSNSQVDASAEEEEGAKGNGEIDITLSLRDGKYKARIEPYWEKLWGRLNNRDGLTPKEISPKILDNLKAELRKSGGKLYRSKSKSSFFVPTDNEALEKIQSDLRRGKQDYNGSIFRGISSSDQELDAPDSEGEGDASPMSSPAFDNSAKLSVSPATPSSRDLVVSLRDDKYEENIQKIVATFVDGQSNCQLTTVVSEQVEKVLCAGGKIFKLAKRGEYTEVHDKEAIKKITADVRDKLTDARKNNARYVVVNKRNERYINAITEAVKDFVEERRRKLSSISEAEEISRKMLEMFQSSGARHFFNNAVDESEMACDDALAKIMKDVYKEARFLTPQKVSKFNSGTNDGMLSSTRKRQHGGRKRQHGGMMATDTRGFIAYRVSKFLGRNHDEWTVKRKVKNGLDTLVAHCERPGGPSDLEGHDDILDYCFLSGFYEEHFAKSDEGKRILELGGILDDPESIFSDDIRRERSRHKQMNVECEVNHVGKEQESKELKNEKQKDSNDQSEREDVNGLLAAARATSRVTGGASNNESLQDNSREAPKSPIILLDDDDPPSESEPVTIKDEETSQNSGKPEAINFGESRAEIREIFKDVLQSFNEAEVENDAAGIDFFGHLKQFLEMKANNDEFNLGDDAKIIIQASKLFKEDKEQICLNPFVPFFKKSLNATIKEAKDKLPLP